MLVPEAVVISAFVAVTVPGHHARYQPLATVACTELPSLRSIVTAVTPAPVAAVDERQRVAGGVARAAATELDLTRRNAGAAPTRWTWTTSRPRCR